MKKTYPLAFAKCRIYSLIVQSSCSSVPGLKNIKKMLPECLKIVANCQIDKMAIYSFFWPWKIGPSMWSLFRKSLPLSVFTWEQSPKGNCCNVNYILGTYLILTNPQRKKCGLITHYIQIELKKLKLMQEKTILGWLWGPES